MGEQMINRTQQGILTLLKSAVTGEKLQFDGDFDWEAAKPYIKKHQIGSLIYEGAVNCGVEQTLPQMQLLFRNYCKNLVVSEGQMHAINKLCGAFEGANIDYMPVKGCNMKPRYPKPELRAMGDADILIKLEQYDRIYPIMKELGYEEVLESDHELIWRNGVLELELHKRLIPSYNKDYFRYFGDGWQLAKVQKGCRWSMTPEDEYIYLFTHFAKHYRDGGIGLRHVLDLWVFERSVPALDEAYVEQELNKLQLLEFRQNMVRLIKAWFCGEAMDEVTAFISDFVFGSGSWGNKESKQVAFDARDSEEAGSVGKGKLHRAVKILFPTMLGMKQRYPVLQKAPVLLPVFWVVRWVETVLFRRERIDAQKNILRRNNADQIETYQQALNFVGLDFRFKE